MGLTVVLRMWVDLAVELLASGLHGRLALGCGSSGRVTNAYRELGISEMEFD